MNRIDHDTEEAIQRFLALIATRYDTAGAIIHGSRARGTHHPDSDADVAVLLSGEHQRFLPTKLVLLQSDIVMFSEAAHVRGKAQRADNGRHPYQAVQRSPRARAASPNKLTIDEGNACALQSPRCAPLPELWLWRRSHALCLKRTGVLNMTILL